MCVWGQLSCCFSVNVLYGSGKVGNYSGKGGLTESWYVVVSVQGLVLSQVVFILCKHECIAIPAPSKPHHKSDFKKKGACPNRGADTLCVPKWVVFQVYYCFSTLSTSR